MRKVLTLFLSILLLFALAGCSSNPQAVQTTQAPQSPTPAAEVAPALPVMNPVPEPDTSPVDENPIDRAFARFTGEQDSELSNVIFAYLYARQWRVAYEKAEQLHAENRGYYFYPYTFAESAYEYALKWTDSNEPTAVFRELARFYKLFANDSLAQLMERGFDTDIWPDEDDLYRELTEVNFAGAAVPETFDSIDLADAQDDKSNPIPALAALHDEDIILYYCEFGAVLSVKGEQIFYPWRDFLTPRGILPRLSLLDTNGDGLDELAVILYTGSGTGIAVEELHLVGLQGDARFDDLHVTSREIKDQLFHRLSAQYDMKKDTIEVKLDHQTLSIDVSDIEKVKNPDFRCLDLDSIIHFNAENGSLSVHLTIGLSGFDHIVSFDYVDLTAGLQFDASGNITLVDPHLDYLH